MTCPTFKTKTTFCIATFVLLIALLPVATTPLPEVQCSPCPSGCQCPAAGPGSCQVLCHDVTLEAMPSVDQMPNSVIKMSFYNCSISEIPASYFKSFPDLQYLNLSHNSLHDLQADDFISLQRLHSLDLSSNNLKSLPNGIFAKQSDLQHLYLTRNFIWNLPRNVFRYLVALKTLSLENNALSNLEEISIMPMKNLEKFYVAKNPWHCSCDLRWLGRWLKSHGNPTDIACASPSYSAGQPLVDLWKLLPYCQSETFKSRRLLREVTHDESADENSQGDNGRNSTGSVSPGSQVNNIPVFVSKLNAASSLEALTMEVKTSPSLVYWSSVDNITHQVTSSVVQYKFPSAGCFKMSVKQENNGPLNEFPVLIEDPIVSAKILSEQFIVPSPQTTINLTIPQGSNVHINWTVISSNGSEMSLSGWQPYDKKYILIVNSPKTFSEAVNHCDSLGAGLLEVFSDGKLKKLSFYLDDKKYYLGAERVNSKWRWMQNGEETYFSSEEDTLSLQSPNLNCISAHYDTLEQVDCGRSLPFICQTETKDTQQSPCGQGESYDAKENKCYYLTFVGKSWKDAKESCRQMGGKVAAIKRQDLLQQLKKDLLLNHETESIWIGLQSFHGLNLWIDDLSTHDLVPEWSSSTTVFPNNYCMVLQYKDKWSITGVPCHQITDAVLCSYHLGEYVEQVPVFNVGAKDIFGVSPVTLQAKNAYSSQYSGPTRITLLPDYSIPRDGTLWHWLFETGDITSQTELHLLVFQVECQNGERITPAGCSGHISPVTKCLMTSPSCDPAPQCSLLSQFCPWSRECQKLYQDCYCNCTVPDTVGSLYGSSLPQFTLVGKTIVTLEPQHSRKSLFVTADDIAVKENYILAIQEEQAQSALKCVALDSSVAIDVSLNEWLPIGNRVPALTSTQGISKKRCQLQAVYTQPVTVSLKPFQHELDIRQQMSVVFEITLTNHVSSYKLQKAFIFLSPVTGFKMQLPAPQSGSRNASVIAVEADKSTVFVWTILSGSDAQFHWNIPGSQNFSFTDQCDGMGYCESLPHQFVQTSFQALYQLEPYHISAKAFNEISSASISFSVLAQIPISGLQIDHPKLWPLGSSGLIIEATVAKGSHLQFEWTLNGTNVPVKTSRFDISLLSTPGTCLITVRCFNSLSARTSDATVLLYIPAQPHNLDLMLNSVYVEEKMNFALNLAVAAVKGSQVTFIVDFRDGSAIEHRVEYLNGKSSVMVMVNHAYNNTGSYSILVWVVDSTLLPTASFGDLQMTGAAISKSQDVFVEPLLTDVNLTSSALTVPTGNPVTFTVHSPTGTLTYDWIFGDGNTKSTTQSFITHTFSISGIYSVQARVSNRRSSRTLTVQQNVQDSISNLQITVPRPVYKGVQVTFQASVSSGTDVMFAFNSGMQGDTFHLSSNNLYSQVYPSEGQYNVTVKAFNDVNKVKSWVMISVYNTSTFVIDKINGPACAAVNVMSSFTAIMVSNSPGTLTYQWSVDGVVKVAGDDATLFQHQFSALGVSTISLTVTDGQQATSASKIVCIQEAISGVFISPEKSSLALKANSTTAVTVFITVTQGSNYNFRWIVEGDITVSAAQGSHVVEFKTPGEKKIILEVFNKLGSVRKETVIQVQEVISSVEMKINGNLNAAYVSSQKFSNFNLIAGAGSHLQFEWFFHQFMLNYTTQSVAVKFPYTGVYNVIGHVSNRISNVTVHHVLQVIDPIILILLTAEKSIAAVNETVQFKVILASKSLEIYKWEACTVVKCVPLKCKTSVCSSAFQTSGVYVVRVHVQNPVSVASKYIQLIIQPRIKNIEITPGTPFQAVDNYTSYMALGENLDFQASVLDNFSISFSWKIVDGTNVSKLQVSGRSISYHFDKVGQFLLALTVQNDVDSATVYKRITIQDKIRYLHFSPLMGNSCEFGFFLCYEPKHTTGTSVTYHWEVLDQSNVVLYSSSEQKLIYKPPEVGYYMVVLQAQNMVSKDTYQTMALSQTPISATKIIIDPGSRISVLTAHPVRFALNSFNADLNYKWTFFNTKPPTNYSTASLIYRFPKSGTYLVKVAVSNAFREVILTKEVIVFQQMPTLTVVANVTSVATGGTVMFESVMKQDDESDIKWFIDDAQEASGSRFFTHSFQVPGAFRVSAYCSHKNKSESDELTINVEDEITDLQLNCCTEVAAIRTIQYFNASVKQGTNVKFTWTIFDDSVYKYLNASINHTFLSPGNFIVQVEASNQVSQLTRSQNITVQEPVSSVSLLMPNNIIVGQKVNIVAIPVGGSNLHYEWHLNFKVWRVTAMPFTSVIINASGIYRLKVTAKNNVSDTSDTKIFTSTLVKCDPLVIHQPLAMNNRTVMRSSNVQIEMKVIVDCTRYKIMYRWQIHHGTCGLLLGSEIDLGDRASVDSPQLIILSRTLDYGNYCAEFKAWYDQAPLETKTYVNLTIVPSRPIAIIAGGSERTFSTNEDILLDGTKSYDPDIEDGHNSLLRYHWSCVSQTHGMCFEDTYTDNVIIPHTVLQAGTEMLVTLNVSVSERDVGNGTIDLKLMIKPPTVSQVEIECLSCRESNIYTMSSTRPIKLLGSCTNCGPDVHYEWSVFDEDLKQIHLTDANSTTGLSGRNLAVKNNILDSNKGHYFHLTASSQRQSSTGYAMLHLKPNQPPTGGICNLTIAEYSEMGTSRPSVRALTDMVQISCTGWRDPDDPLKSPLIYHMYVQRAGFLGWLTGDWYPLYRGTQSFGSFYLSQWEQDQYISVHVEVIDVMGAVTDGFKTPIKLDITAPDALMNLTITILPNVALRNDPKIIRQYCLALAIQFNLFNDKSGNLEERMQMRQFILRVAHTTLDSTNSLDDAQQFIYILQHLTDPFELPEDNETFVMILDILDAITKTFSRNANPSTDGDLFLPLQLIETLGNMIKVDRGATKITTTSGTTPVSPYAMEYFNVAHLVMVLYSLTRISGERPFVFDTGSLNSMGRKSVLEDIPLDQRYMNFSLSLPYIENIGLKTREVFQSVVTLTFNPFNWGYTYPITSQVMSLSYYDTDGGALDIKSRQDRDGMIELGLPASPVLAKLPEPSPFRITLQPGQTLTTSFTLTAQAAAHINFEIISIPSEVLSDKQLFTSNYMRRHGIDPPDGAVVAYLSKISEPLYDQYDKMLFLEDTTRTEDRTFFISDREAEADVIHHMTLTNTNTARNVSVMVTLFYSQCLFYNEGTNKWDNYGCHVTEESTSTFTKCRCSHLTLFGSSVHHSAVNLDFREIQRLNIRENPVVIILASVIAGIYLLALIFARKRDNRSQRLASVTPLCGKDGVFKYEINITTGRYLSAGTSAHVGIIIHGTDGRSSPRHLTKDGAFKRNGDDTFMVAMDHCLGDLTKVKLWHDNTGMSPSWFVHRIIIKDLHTGKRYYFHFNRWLSLETKDGAIEYEVPVSADEELVKFENYFKDATWKGFADGHIWLSLINRPQKSRFTNVQRLTSCVTLLYCFMMTNVIWYGVLNEQPSELDFALGHIAVDWQDLLVGALASLLAFPPIYVLTVIFKRSRNKPKVRDLDEKSDTAQTIEIDAYCDVSSAAGSSFISRSSRGPPSDGLKRSVSDVVKKPQNGIVGRLRRTGALRKLFHVDSLDDMTDTSSAVSGFTNNNTIKDDLAKRIPGANKPLYSKDGIMEWPQQPGKWWETSPAGKHRRAISNVSEDSTISENYADDATKLHDRIHPRIVLRRPTAQTVYLEASIDEREEDTYVSPVPPKTQKSKDIKEEVIPMKTMTVDKTVQTETVSNRPRHNSEGPNAKSNSLLLPRRRRSSFHHVPCPAPEPILEHHVSEIVETYFNPNSKLDTETKTAIREIERNMGERPPVKPARKPRKHHSQNTGRGHHRGASSTSTDSHESHHSSSSEKSGHVNESFVGDDGEAKTHKRQESGVSVTSEMSDLSTQNPAPLHKTRSSRISKRWENIVVVPEDLGYSDGGRSGRYDSDDSGSWVPPPVHHLSRTSTFLSYQHGADSANEFDNSGVTLPHYFVYVAYIMCLALSVFSVIVTLLYGNSFGIKLALKWLLAFIMSLLGSIFVIEPLKVILIALVMSLLNPSPYERNSFFVTAPVMQMSETIKDVRIRPVGGFALMQAREETKKLQRMRLLLRQAAVYFLFLWVMIVLCYTRQTDTHYQLNQAVQTNYGWSPTVNQDSLNQTSWYDNMFSDALNNLYRPKDDNFQLYLMGIPRLRQKRARIGPCPIPTIQNTPREITTADTLVGCRTKEEDKASYLEGWLIPQKEANYTWVYTNHEDALGESYEGKVRDYNGGGYIIPLASTLPASENIVRLLELEGWIDRGTEAVFLEATFYYPPKNFFTSVILATEYPLSGGVYYSSSVQTISMAPWRDGVVDSETVFVVLLGLISLYLFIHIVLQILKQRMRYFTSFWNCFELVMFLLAVLSLTSYVLKVREDSEKIAQIAKRERKYVSLAMNFEADKRWNNINAFIMFMLTIWIVKQMRFIKSWSIYGNTLKGSLPPLLGLTLIITIVVFVYGQLGYLWYGTAARAFSSLFHSVCNLVVLMRGTFSEMNVLLQFDMVFTHLYIMSFMAVTLISMMALVVAILNSTYHSLKKQAHYYDNMDLKDYEMIEFTMKRFKRWLGLTKEKPAFRQVKFQGLPSASTMSSLKSGVAPGSSISTDSSGMSEVMDLLEAESQAYLDGLLERALPTWNNMLDQLTLVEEVDKMEKKMERYVYEKLLQVRIRGLKPEPEGEKEMSKDLGEATACHENAEHHCAPSEVENTKPSEIKKQNENTVGPPLSETPSRPPSSSKLLRRFSEQITSKSKTNKVCPARAHSDMGVKTKQSEQSEVSSDASKAVQAKLAW